MLVPFFVITCFCDIKINYHFFQGGIIMGHAINTQVYEESVNKAELQASWDYEARMEGYLEGSSGLPRAIRWVQDPILSSQKEAEEWIESHDRGHYDQLAVRFYNKKGTKRPNKTKAHIKAEEKLKSLLAEKEDFERNPFAGRTSKTVGCKKCGCSFNHKALIDAHKHQRFGKSGNLANRLYCPVCFAFLISATDQKRYKRLIERIEEAEKALKEQDSNYKKKCESVNFEIQWLVKTEYHI